MWSANAARGETGGVEAEPGGEVAWRLHSRGVARNEHAAERLGFSATRRFFEVEQGDLTFPCGGDRAADYSQRDAAVGVDAIEQEPDLIHVSDECDGILVGSGFDDDLRRR